MGEVQTQVSILCVFITTSDPCHTTHSSGLFHCPYKNIDWCSSKSRFMAGNMTNGGLRGSLNNISDSVMAWFVSGSQNQVSSPVSV